MNVKFSPEQETWQHDAHLLYRRTLANSAVFSGSAGFAGGAAFSGSAADAAFATL